MGKKFYRLPLMTLVVFAVLMITTGAMSKRALAATGDSGFFGGITEGVRLPKTTELLLAKTGSNTFTNVTNMPYKEVLFLNGVPATFEGLLDVKYSGGIADTAASGTYKVAYTVKNSTTTDAAVTIKRSITYDVKWRREGSQIVKDYTVSAWTETLVVNGATFVLDRGQSHFDISILEVKTPGVTYYKGDVSQKAVYRNQSGGGRTTLDVSGSFYGYNSAWSNTETYRLDGEVYNDVWQMSYQIRPSVSVSKTLQYSRNEPTAISFSGNYREVMQNESGLQYDIFNLPAQFYGTPETGNEYLKTYNTFEQLTAPDVSWLKGHAAEEDIAKLFSMQILEGDSTFYKPNQSITRAQYVTMLAKAIKLPIDKAEQQAAVNNSKKVTINVIFPDVMPEREEYAYIMAAYRAGLAVGRGNGLFHSDYSIQREEAIVILLRTIGLGNLGLNPTPVTPFADDSKISSWAKKEIYAALRIGLIYPDANGNFKPGEYITKAEAAALVNRLIEYMRSGIANDYKEHIVNYTY